MPTAVSNDPGCASRRSNTFETRNRKSMFFHWYPRARLCWSPPGVSHVDRPPHVVLLVVENRIRRDDAALVEIELHAVFLGRGHPIREFLARRGQPDVEGEHRYVGLVEIGVGDALALLAIVELDQPCRTR